MKQTLWNNFWNLNNLYTKDDIVSLIENFEKIFNIRYSEKIFNDLNSKTQEYVDFVINIKNAILIFNKWKRQSQQFNYNQRPVINWSDQSELLELEKQMKIFIKNWPIHPNVETSRLLFKRNLKFIL